MNRAQLGAALRALRVASGMDGVRQAVRELASDPQWFQYGELAVVIDYKGGTNAL